MSYDTYVGGEIVITPPVPAAIVADSPFGAETVTEAGREVFLRADPDRQATLILPAGAEGYTRNAEDIAGHVNEIVGLVGDGHVFAGELRCEGEHHDDIWRVRVVAGQAVEEYAEVVYPGDFPVPDGLAVAFDAEAALAWLAGPVNSPTRTGYTCAELYGIAVDGVYDAACGDRLPQWVERLVADLDLGQAPHVWRTAAGVGIGVVETTDAEGLADGGAVVLVSVGGLVLASRWLEDDQLAVHECDERGRGTKPQLDAVIEALSTVAAVVNAVVDRYRTARAVAALAPAGGVRFGHLNYHTPGQPAHEATVGRWTFLLAPHVADFTAAWQAAVAEFRADAHMQALAAQQGHSLNYGDLIEHGTHILARHGLELVAEPAAGSVTVEHDTPLIDRDGS